MHPDIVIPLAGIALPMILVPTILTLRQAGKKREYAHLERMKALEMGQPVPGESNWAQAFACAAVGLGVPSVAFLFTMIAVLNAPSTPGEIWMAPAVVSCFALMSSAGMAGKVFCTRKKPDAPAEAKFQMDPDAYDVVGSRG
jgi:hypothetical protein